MSDTSRLREILRARRQREALAQDRRITIIHAANDRTEDVALARVTAVGEARWTHPLAPLRDDRLLLPVIGANDDLTPTLERALAPVAHRAWSGDRAARDALYFAFEPKLMRFVRTIHPPFAPTGDHAVWERDDVGQEAYLAFTEVVASWTPPIPFGRYVLAHFSWRLRDAVFRGVARARVPVGATITSGEQLDWLADETYAASESRILLETLAASLEPPYDDLLRWHIGEGMSLQKIAARLGCSRRTVTRRWQKLLAQLRASYEGP